MTPAQLFSYFKSSRTLMIGRVADDHWITDRYMAVKVPEKSPVVDLLAAYNLTLEPMACKVGRTIVRTSTDGPDLAELLAPIKVAKAVPLDHWLVDGVRILVNTGVGGGAGVFCDPAGNRYTYDPKKVDVVAALRDGEWLGTAPDKPLLYVDGRELVGLCMPIRDPFSAAAKKEAA